MHVGGLSFEIQHLENRTAIKRCEWQISISSAKKRETGGVRDDEAKNRRIYLVSSCSRCTQIVTESSPPDAKDRKHNKSEARVVDVT